MLNIPELFILRINQAFHQKKKKRYFCLTLASIFSIAPKESDWQLHFVCTSKAPQGLYFQNNFIISVEESIFSLMPFQIVQKDRFEFFLQV